MAEESFQEKTEPSTPKRREEGRQKGQVARSNELSSVAILMAGLLSLSALGAYMYEHLTGFMVNMFVNSYALEIDALTIRRHAWTWMAGFLKVVGPLVAMLVAAALAINYAQVGVLFTAKPLEPKMNRISPLSGSSACSRPRAGGTRQRTVQGGHGLLRDLPDESLAKYRSSSPTWTWRWDRSMA